MEKYSLGSIKRDSIRRVFACIKNKELISRLEISQQTGLSLMTVGKIADALAEKDVIIQQKGTTGSVGRKASYISLNKDNFALVLDIAEKTPSFTIVNICGEILYFGKFDTYGDTSLKGFFESVKTYVDMNYLLDPCMGIGVIADDSTEFEKDFRAIFQKDPNVKITPVKAKAAAEISGERSALYFELCLKTVSGAYLLDGEMCDIDGVVTGAAADSVLAICAFLSPRKVVLNGDTLNCAELKHNISNKCKKTEVVIIDANDSEKSNEKYKGCAAFVADEYINITKRL